jgi:hypothetical protein
VELDISDKLAAKANRFPESSYGASTVTLILASGRRIDNVVLAGPRIVKVGSRMVSGAGDLDFSPGEIADVVRSDRPVLAILRQAWQQLCNVGRVQR